MTRLVAVCSSPVKKGNSEYLTNHMVAVAEKLGCEAEVFYLSRMEIKECIHCNGCIAKQKPGKYCLVKDDAQPIFEACEAADIILLSSPVYHMRMNARMAAFTDRMRIFIFGNETKGRLENKIGISGAVAWKRHGGFETTHLAHHHVFYNLDMLPVGCHHSLSPLGASGVSSQNGEGIFDPKMRLGVAGDGAGLKSGELLVKRAVSLAGKLR
ncbi:MAG: flavodoxin family protein [Desulfobacterales bacterium]|nr:flavodoxin family protein [Desulfobacterales bacterium]